jgi:hypothetical protein
MTRRFSIVLFLIVMFAGCVYDYPVLPDKFSAIQKQTFDRACTGSCHAGSLSSTNGFLLLNQDSAYSQLFYTHIRQNTVRILQYPALVVPFHPDSSYLIFKLTLPENNDSDGYYMPNNNTGHIPQNEIDAIISWIKRGAPND